MENTILNNELIILPVFAWFVAQLLKFIIEITKYRKFNFRRFIGSGGMPSSHTSFITCIATLVGFKEGWSSTEFAIIGAMALIVMYDAAGVRRAAGKQATVLNKIVEEFQQSGKFNWNIRLKEFIGHTPLEVFGGCVLGILIAIIFYIR